LLPGEGKKTSHRVGAFEASLPMFIGLLRLGLTKLHRVGAFEARPIYIAAVGKRFIVFDVSGSLTQSICLLTMQDAIAYDCFAESIALHYIRAITFADPLRG
jgi:hypothetical protein